MFRFENQHLETLVIDYKCCVIDYTSLKMFYHKLWLLKFEIQRSKTIGNQLHVHGNRLLLCKTVIKLFWASGNRLLSYGNRLPESKNSGKRFFFEKLFWTNCAIQSFLWKILFILILMVFLIFLHILSLLLNLLDFLYLF